VREQARQFLGTVEKRLCGHQDVHFHSLVRKGFPGEEIVKMIDTQGVDLVVLGARGYSKTTGFFLGSVSLWVLHDARCSVLIGGNTPSKNKKIGGMNLLLATDGSPDAQAAVGFLKTVGFPPNSQLIILHVVKGRVSQTEPVPATYRTQQAEWLKLSQDLIRIRRREGRRLLQETRLALTGSGLKIVERLTFGNEAHEIFKTPNRLERILLL
jgi:nucleotide-binding universal stress UspA family protein